MYHHSKSQSVEPSLSFEGRYQSSKGKGKEVVRFRPDEIPEEEEGESETEAKTLEEEDEVDIIWEAMKPKICEDSLMVRNFTQEEIEELKKRLDEVADAYDRNLEKGISYEETSQMLYRGELAIKV